jgi:hypothetical protein
VANLIKNFKEGEFVWLDKKPVNGVGGEFEWWRKIPVCSIKILKACSYI